MGFGANHTGACSVACCQIIVFAVCLVALITPQLQTLKQQVILAETNETKYVLLGTGAWNAGVTFRIRSRGDIYIFPQCPQTPCTIMNQGLSWESVPSDQACNKTSIVYKLWSGPYKLCSDSGQFLVPAPVTNLRALGIIAVLLSFIVLVFSCVTCCSEKLEKLSLFAYILAFLSFLTLTFSVASFAQYLNWLYSQQLLNGESYVPLMDTSQNLVIIPSILKVGIGLGAWFMVSSVTFFTTLFFCILGYFYNKRYIKEMQRRESLGKMDQADNIDHKSQKSNIPESSTGGVSSPESATTGNLVEENDEELIIVTIEADASDEKLKTINSKSSENDDLQIVES